MTIWPPYEAFYIESMLFNSSSAIASIHLVADAFHAVSQGTRDATSLDHEALLDHLQNIVLQGAALSRYFWPSDKSHEARGQQLRLALSISETSPLRSRLLRNGLEHFDERLDDYLSRGVVGTVLPRYVGLSPRTDGVPLHLFRAYFVDRGVFSLLGEQYDIQPLADEIGRVHNVLLECANSGGSLRTR